MKYKPHSFDPDEKPRDPDEMNEDEIRAKNDGGHRHRPNGGAASAQATPPPRPSKSLPRLEVVKSSPDLTVARVRNLFANAGCFFERGVPVLLAFDKSLGGLVAHIVTPEVVILETHERSRPFMTVFKDGGLEEIDIQLPKPIATMYLRSMGKWQLPVLNGITSAPLLSDDGTIRTAAGYDEHTGLWFQHVPDVAALVPECPTKKEAQRSLFVIRCLFRTFCFADAITLREGVLKCVDLSQPIGLDESSFLNALLTAVCRPSLWLAPGVMATAPLTSGSGAGKGLLMRGICEIAFGEQPTAFTAGPTPEETEKRIAAKLIEARQAVLLDNLNDMNFRSPQLESAITERPCDVRNFGVLKNVTLNSSAFIMVNGNGLGVSGDTARRFPMVIELDAEMEDPESRRGLDVGAFKAEVRERRAELLAHALTIWRYGRRTELETAGIPFGSFEQWARWVRDPLLALGCKDPVQRVEAMKAQDPHRRNLNDIFTAWNGCHGDDEMTAWGLSENVKELLIEEKDKRTRQAIAAKVNKLAKSRVAGYVLHRIPPPNDDKWAPAKFKLEKLKTKQEEAANENNPF